MSGTAVGRTFRLLFTGIETSDPRRRRLLGLLQGAVTGLGNKLLTMAISFLSVPLTIGYLGAERYGAWVTIGSLLAWAALTDFGLGNGMQNAVTTAAGQERPDLVRMHLSNGAALLCGIAAGVGALAAVAWPWIDWSALLGVTSPGAQAEVGTAAGLALAIFLAQFPLSVTGKLYFAYHEGRIGNYWGVANNVATFAALIVVTRSGGGLVSLVAAMSGVPLLVNVCNTLWMFVRHRPELRPGLPHVHFGEMRTLTRTGGKFFLLQILALIIFQTDNLVIAHFLGARNVPEYSITYTLFAYAALPQSMMFGYVWNAYADAIARKDVAWVRRTFRINLLGGVAFTAVAVAAVCVIARPFIGAWAGDSVVPSWGLIGWMAAWAMIGSYCNPCACLLAATSQLKAQIIYSAAATALNIGLTLHLVKVWGVSGVLAGTVISYVVFVLGPVTIDIRRLLWRLEHEV